MLEYGKVSRRGLIRAATGVFIASTLPNWRRADAAGIAERNLTAQVSRIALVGAPYPDTSVWTYNGLLPGPEIRIRQGERLRVHVRNSLDQETTIHWHGVRVPNAMD